MSAHSAKLPPGQTTRHQEREFVLQVNAVLLRNARNPGLKPSDLKSILQSRGFKISKPYTCNYTLLTLNPVYG